jgi:hypothetical protein
MEVRLGSGMPKPDRTVLGNIRSRENVYVPNATDRSKTKTVLRTARLFGKDTGTALQTRVTRIEEVCTGSDRVFEETDEDFNPTVGVIRT